jgi:hypothetical protein
MRRAAIYIILSLVCVNIAEAKINFFTQRNIGKDTTIAPSKDEILSSLISLRDSIDNSVLATQKKREQNKSNYTQYFDNAYAQLTSQRREIEKVIEEVVTSNEQTWDENIRTRAIREISTRRRDYHQTLETLTDVLGSKNKLNK